MAISNRPYYDQGSYPQYKGLTSGVNMMGNDAVPQGIASMNESMIQIQQQEYADESERQAKFKNLIDVSLKDVRGQWQDEAVTKKQSFLDNATKLAAESMGKLTWDQEKQLMTGKEDLERFAGMSKEVEDWYGKAVTQASQIKDQTAQKKTYENIKNIMATKGLENVYNETLKPDWMEQPKYGMPAVMKLATPTWDNNGQPSVKKLETQYKGLIDTETPAVMEQKPFYDSLPDDKKKLYPTFENWLAEIKAAEMTKKRYNEINYVPSRTGGSTDKRKVIKPEKTGVYRMGDLGIKVNTIDGYKDAVVQDITQDVNTGEYWVRVSHATENISAKEAEQKQIETLGQETYDRFISLGVLKNPKDSKDPVNVGFSFEKYEDVKVQIGRNAIIDGMPEYKPPPDKMYTINGADYSEDQLLQRALEGEEMRAKEDGLYERKPKEQILADIKKYEKKEETVKNEPKEKPVKTEPVKTKVTQEDRNKKDSEKLKKEKEWKAYVKTVETTTANKPLEYKDWVKAEKDDKGYPIQTKAEKEKANKRYNKQLVKQTDYKIANPNGQIEKSLPLEQVIANNAHKYTDQGISAEEAIKRITREYNKGDYNSKNK